MTSPMRLFRRSDLSTHCEQCKLSYDLTQMGACRECRRVLCNTHLHGSFWQRLKVDFGSPAVCVKCRHGATRA